MLRTRVVSLMLVAFTAVIFMAPAVSAQQESGIAGVVKDTSGAVLPGVTVEAASPALIEKVQTVVSDSAGLFNFTNLRPGTYAVTFRLPGFSTLKRDGVVLTAAFTARVDAEMRVGASEETITVTGAAPLVDSANVRQQQVASSELLADLPSSAKTQAASAIALGAGVSGTSDVGGAAGLYRGNGQSGGLFFHGKNDVTVLYDGMGTASPGGSAQPYVMNMATAQERTVETGGGSAQSNATILMNTIPKTGGNTFASNVSGSYSGERLQSDNLTDEVRARGVTHTNKAVRLYDANVSVGGPIKQDRLWFLVAGRMVGNKNTVANVFFNKTQGTPLYTPDLDRQAYRREWLKSIGGRLTWQASQKHKVSGFADLQSFYNRARGEFASPEAYTHMYNFWPQGLFQTTWSSPRTSKFLLEAGASYMMGRWPYPSPGDGVYRVSPDDISILELSSNFRYNARTTYANVIDQYRNAQRFSASYVTGSHAFKGGVQVEEGITNVDSIVHGNVNYAFLNQVPNRVTQFMTYEKPYLKTEKMTELGLFVQDQWIRKRLTLNYGLRFDYLYGYVPAQHVPASRFIPFAQDFAPVHGAPSFTDLNPRLGAAYDLFGTGRTALKVSLGRYVETGGTRLTGPNNPITTAVSSVNRTWNDANRNYIPDCDLTNFAGNGECGPISDLNFGKNNPRATRYADDVLRGFGNRNVSWDFSTELQQELRPGVSVTGGYYRNWAGNFRATDNLAVTPGDYSPYCITAPVDPRLPGGGGYQVCGLYDVAPAKFGQVENLVTRASHFYGPQDAVTCGGPGTIAGNGGSGSACSTSDFFGVSVATRFGSGIQLGGGVDTGRTVVDNCYVIDSPQQLLNCRTVKSFKAQTQVKFNGSYPLPGDFIVSGTFQNNSGRPIEADYEAPNAAIAPSLGRNLAACGTRAVCTASAPVPLVAPNTLFMDRRVQLDLRLSKVLRLGPKARFRANVDVYNVLNAGTVLAVNSRYGPTWQQPAATLNVEVDSILSGRQIHLGGQLTF